MRTKIVCTIGPVTESPEMIEKLIVAGMNIARLNFSHGSYEEHRARIQNIRKISKKIGKKVEILCDLQGPKIRVNDFGEKPIKLTDGEKVTLVTSICKDIKENDICIEDAYLHTDIKKADIVLIDDGLIELVVEDVHDHHIECLVVNGGNLYSRKGVNVPLTKTTTSSLTEKDKEDLKFILTQDPEWVAISFVQGPEDVSDLKKLLTGHDNIRIMCKIERANAIRNLNGIINEADGIMVARGDLGVELPFDQLPIIQKQIIRICNYRKKPVVTATQMLASMVDAPVPTRAEVTDIANAVIDGTDAVMLSNETTVGKYPIDAVETISKVIETTENFIFDRNNRL